MCAIKTFEEKGGVTIHLPRELLGITKIILDSGVKLTTQLIRKHCYRSLLVKD